MRTGNKNLHLVAAEVFVGKTFEIVAELFAGCAFRERGRNLGILQDLLVHKNRAIHAQRERQRVAGAGIDHRQLAVAFDPDHGVEGVVLQVADDDLIHARLEPEKNVAQQIVRHRAGSLHFFDFESDGVCFVNADPDGEDRVTLHIFQDDDRHVRHGVHHQAANLHLDFHGVLPFSFYHSADAAAMPNVVPSRRARRSSSSAWHSSPRRLCSARAIPDARRRYSQRGGTTYGRSIDSLSATSLPRALRISVQAISRLLRFEFFAAIPSTRRGDGFFLLREWRRPWIQQGYSGAENI